MPIIRHGYSQRRNTDNAQRARNRSVTVNGATHCAICGDPFLHGDKIEADHIQPISTGGTDDLWNLRPVHRTCNRRRGQG